MKSPRLTILNFHNTFPDNDTCLRFLFNARFPEPKCATCKGTKFYKHPTRACFTCAKGCTHLWPKEGTIFDHSSTDLVKWFFAIFLMSQSRNGVAAKELERALGVTYKCAFRIGHHVRKLMKDNAFTLFGDVEADETAVGGRRHGKRGRGAEGKTIVFGALQREGMMNAAIVPNVKAKTLMPYLEDNVAKGSKLMTDELKSYKKIARLLDMEHDTVTHGAGQFGKDNGTNTNTIEGFWSQLKRSLDGTHHVISPKMLHAYVSEFQWRYNNRKSVTHLFELLLSRVSSQLG